MPGSVLDTGQLQRGIEPAAIVEDIPGIAPGRLRILQCPTEWVRCRRACDSSKSNLASFASLPSVIVLPARKGKVSPGSMC